jgi:fumarate hydratase subunit alpha
MIREIDVGRVTDAVCQACIEANHTLSPDMAAALERAAERETDPLAWRILSQLRENLRIAGEEQVPICQDTGMAVVFLDIGQDVHFTGGDLAAAVHEGVRRACREGYLRPSVVDDPLLRTNTGDNSPAVLHCAVVPGRHVTITVAPKGFGSENMSRLFLLKPADGAEGVREAVLRTVAEAGPNACPPLVVGVGLGGTMEQAALLAKRALLRPVGEGAPQPHIRALEWELLERINALGIGPSGLGGDTTALAVHVNACPTHIAGLPVAVNLCCHVNRHVRRTL